jgi:hypothetical protein
MVILDKKTDEAGSGEIDIPEPGIDAQVEPKETEKPVKETKKESAVAKAEVDKEEKNEEPNEEDIPF